MMFTENGHKDEEDTLRLARSQIEDLFRIGLEQWDKSNYQIGDTIPAEWFYDLLGVLHPSKANSFEHSEAARKNFMMLYHGQDGFRAYVLKHRKRWLKTNYAGGYEVLDPKEQTQYARKQRRNDINKALREENTLLSNVDLNLISQKERQENAEAIAHNVALAKILHRKRPGFDKK